MRFVHELLPCYRRWSGAELRRNRGCLALERPGDVVLVVQVLELGVLTDRHDPVALGTDQAARTRSATPGTGVHWRITGAQLTVLHGRSPLLLSRESRSVG